MPSNFDKYMSGHGAVSTVLQRNVREYYNDLKMLRADSQVRVWVVVGCPAWALGVWRCSPPTATLLHPASLCRSTTPCPTRCIAMSGTMCRWWNQWSLRTAATHPWSQRCVAVTSGRLSRARCLPAVLSHTCISLPTPLQDARDFGIDGYTLRLQRLDRQIKLFICITLYNEDQDTLRKTIMGVCDVSSGRVCARGRKGCEIGCCFVHGFEG